MSQKHVARVYLCVCPVYKPEQTLGSNVKLSRLSQKHFRQAFGENLLFEQIEGITVSV